MSNDFIVNAEARADVGKGASRRLRRQAGKVPAIIYGGDKPTESITVMHKDLMKSLENDAIFSSIITVKQDGKTQDVILKDLQRHPAKNQILHADFMRVSSTRKLQTRIPLRFLNEEDCVGVKTQRGILAHMMNDLEVSCLPGDLPDFIEVDVANLEVGQMLHISDLTLPEGVESVDLSLGEDHNQPVVAVNKPRVSSDEEEDGGGEEAGEDTPAAE